MTEAVSVITDLRTKLGHEFAIALNEYHGAAAHFRACDGYEPYDVVEEARAGLDKAAYELSCAVQRCALKG